MTIEAAKIERTSKVEVQKLKKLLDKIKIAAIKTIGMNFLEGINDIIVMVDLPRVIIMHSIMHSEALVEGLQVCSKYTQDRDIERVDFDALLEELRNSLAKIPLIKDKKVEDRINQLVTPLGNMWANLELERILKLHEQHKKSYFTLVHSSVVWMWTLFEIATADLWETTLNVGFDVLGKDVLNRMAKNNMSSSFEDKMRGKYIKVDYLAEFDYDIREHVGSILKRYFDFSSLPGIRNAYKFVFPRSTTIEKSLSNNILRQLAEDRNLIVHRAGYIDMRYKRVIDTAQNIGDKLKIDPRHTELYAAVVIKVFRDMLNCADKYLSLGSKLP